MTDAYPHLTRRRADLSELLVQAVRLLNEYDKMKPVARTPRQLYLLEEATSDIKKLMSQFETELLEIEVRLAQLAAAATPGQSQVRTKLVSSQSKAYDLLHRLDRFRLKLDDPVEQEKVDQERAAVRRQIRAVEAKLTRLDNRPR